MSRLHPGQLIPVNKPEITDVFTLPEKEEHVHLNSKHLIIEKDLRVVNTHIFTIYLEDHTFAHPLRCALVQDPHVIFAAYKVPHPLEPKVVFRVTTTDASHDAIAIFYKALDDLSKYTKLVKNTFDHAVHEYKQMLD